MNFSQLDSNMQSYIHQLAWAQFVQHHQKQMQEAQQQAQTSSNNNNSYAQIGKVQTRANGGYVHLFILHVAVRQIWNPFEG